MISGEEQHPPHQVSGGHPLGPLTLLVSPRRLDDVVGVCTISCHGDVVSMNTEITVVSR